MVFEYLIIKGFQQPRNLIFHHFHVLVFHQPRILTFEHFISEEF